MRNNGQVWLVMAGLMLSLSGPLVKPAAAQGNSNAPQRARTPGDAAELAKELERLSDLVIAPGERQKFASQLTGYVNGQRQRSNQASTQAWSAIRSREDWERFRDEKLARLRQAHGWAATRAVPLSLEVKRRHEDAAGRFVVENIIYQSRPNVWVTANLYRPAQVAHGAPGLVISHAHHTPKEHAELQTMGMTWARAGCYVLVPDHLGHGERRQHPFISADSYPTSFRVSRQDYYFRFDTGIKLHLLGESLLSWLAWDLSRAVDCLLAQPGIDGSKIILLGAVAGGGDPCAVAAALDSRIAAAVPFNFGGPQPETAYPLPEDAATSFNYTGCGSWESTRNLTSSAGDGFLPWVIVGSIAPRRLIYAHEFRWDQEHDPVWRRLQSIYQLYERPDHLAFTHGRGELRGQPPEATHCTHIGAFHRQRIHSALRAWFQIDVSPNDEIFEPLASEMLHCLSDRDRAETTPTIVDFESLALEKIALVRTSLAKQSAPERRRQLRSLWMQLLEPASVTRAASSENLGVRAEVAKTPQVTAREPAVPEPAVIESTMIESTMLRVERVTLGTAEAIQIPTVLLLPAESNTELSKRDAALKWPVVLYVQTLGTSQQLKSQSRELAQLLASGHAVCLCDGRGTGASRSDPGRGRSSASTSISSSLLMHGDPLIAGQLRDLRTVWSWLRQRADIDLGQMKVWGDSRCPAVAQDAERVVPRDDDNALPPAAEPAACMLALLLSLFEDSVHSLCLSGGLSNFSSALKPVQVRLPHDCIVPGFFRAGDIDELVVQAAERMPVRLECPVDGHNQLMSPAAMDNYHTHLQRLTPHASELKLTISPEHEQW